MQKAAIFPLFYLPPIEFFSAALKAKSNLILDIHEHFPKQTYRNRACIHSANGKLDLIVPVIKGSKVHTAMKDVKISYDFNWQRLHWLSLQTSYRSSAFFEFYEADFAPFYEKKWDYLHDYNQEILLLLNRLLKLGLNFETSTSYSEPSEDLLDFRSSIHPKKIAEFTHKSYFQVFEDRNGFIPHLSIIDLLFNQGPQSSQFLNQ